MEPRSGKLYFMREEATMEEVNESSLVAADWNRLNVVLGLMNDPAIS